MFDRFRRPTPPRRVVLITGASSGIGRACATALAQQGYTVYGTSRHPEAYADLPYPLLPLDVTDDAAAEEVVRQVVAREGHLDVLVNNAGWGIAGAVEDTTPAEARALLEVNLLGVHRMVRAALPVMRRQGYGLVVNISSLAGRVGLPFQGFYSASKFALEGLSEALALEVAPFSVQVVLIAPGDFRTDFFNRRQRVAGYADSAYRALADKVLAAMERDEQQAPPPDAVARLLVRILRRPRPRFRYTVGSWVQRAAVGLKGKVPDDWLLSLSRLVYGIPAARPKPRDRER